MASSTGDTGSASDEGKSDDTILPSMVGKSREQIIEMFRESDTVILQYILHGYSLQQISTIHIPETIVIRIDGDPFIKNHVARFGSTSLHHSSLVVLAREISNYLIGKYLRDRKPQ